MCVCVSVCVPITLFFLVFCPHSERERESGSDKSRTRAWSLQMLLRGPSGLQNIHQIIRLTVRETSAAWGVLTLRHISCFTTTRLFFWWFSPSFISVIKRLYSPMGVGAVLVLLLVFIIPYSSALIHKYKSIQ